MKFRNLYITAILLFAAYIFMGHSLGRADSRNWGNTGAPGDETLSNGTSRTCITCHGGNTIAVDLNIGITNLDGSPLENDEYIPGTTYNMSVTIDATTGSPSAYGFQMVALSDIDQAEINTWDNPSSNVEIAFASNTGRTYVEQNVPSSSNVFTMDWTAPEAGRGDITFYSCGNGVNGNGSSNGDGATCSTLTLVEAETSSTLNLNPDFLRMELSPNPAIDILQVSVDTQLSEDLQLNILNLDGKLLHQQQYNSTGTNTVDLHISDLPSGIYFVQLTNSKYSSISKWIKI